MSDCYPKYAGRNTPPFYKSRKKKRKIRGTYEDYYLSQAFNPSSPSAKWISGGSNKNVYYRKPRKSSRNTKKNSRRSKKNSRRRSNKKSSVRKKRIRKRRSIHKKIKN